MKTADNKLCKKLTIAFFLFLLLALLLSPFWFPHLGTYLIVEDNLEKADIIVVLGGGDPQRAVVGAELFKSGFAERVVTTGAVKPDYADVLCGGATFAELGAKLVSVNGVPPRHIEILAEGESTFDEANSVKNYMIEKGYKKAIVVTSIYHTRRARLVFKKVFEKSDIKIMIKPAFGGKLNPEGWWKREEDLIFVNNEWVKLVMYLFKGWIL